MEHEQFDRLTQAVSRLLSRRALGGALGTLGVATLGMSNLAEAKKKRKKKKKKNNGNNNPQVVFNQFGCVNVGDFCQQSAQCCSGICEGQVCQAHDADLCRGGQRDGDCGGVNLECSAPNGNDGLCNSTTGNGGYCTGDRRCLACSKDADCVATCGPDAACILCTGCEGTTGRACAGPVPGSCA